MNTLWQDLRYGARTLLKHKGFTLVAVLTLALGIGANTAIFSVINAVLLRPLPYDEPEQLVVMSEDTADIPNRPISYPNFLDWRSRSHSFEAMSAIRGLQMTLTGEGEPESLDARMVSAEYFDVMRVRPVLGRAFLAEEDKPGAGPVTILSYGFWQQRFGGDPGIVGKAITLDGRPFTVVGVMPRGFDHQGPPPLWVLMGQWTGQEHYWMERDVRVAGYVVARMKKGFTVGQARADMAAVKEGLIKDYPWTNAGHTVRVVPLLETVVGESRRPLWLLFGAVGFVLLIACANVANLLMARATSRSREMAVRAALGASGWRLARQLLVESLMLAALGGAAGLLLAWWGTDLLRASGPAGVPRVADVGIYPRVAWFACALSLLTGVAFGFAPAWRSSRASLAEVLKSGAPALARGAGRLRGALVVAEVALALVLAVGAGLLTRSLARLIESDPGFDPQNVLTMRIALPRERYPDDAQVRRFHQQLLERVSRLPGVRSAAFSNSLPGLDDSWQTDIAVEGHAPVKPGEEINVDQSIVSADYFEAMKIPLRRGRAMTPQEVRDGAAVVVVDENFARRFWPGGDAVGKHIKYDSATPHEIVGVVGDVREFGSETPGRVRIYTPLGRHPIRSALLSVRTAAPDAGLAAAVEREMHAMDKDLPVADVETMGQIFGRAAAPRKFNTTLLGLFAFVALALAAVGIYGVISYTVTQRTREIGVRMALGARGGDVLRLVLRQGMTLAASGVAAGLAASLALTRVMSGLLYGVTPTDPATFAGATVLLTGVALLACLIPARRATKVDPMVALRYE